MCIATLIHDCGCLFRDDFQSLQILLKELIFADAVLETLQVPSQFVRLPLRQMVDAPILMLSWFHQAMLFQVNEVLWDFDLGLVEDRLKMTHAERSMREQMQYPQPSLVTEAFVNTDQVHVEELYSLIGIFRNRNFHTVTANERGISGSPSTRPRFAGRLQQRHPPED
jgi:hypothetical protein